MLKGLIKSKMAETPIYVERTSRMLSRDRIILEGRIDDYIQALNAVNYVQFHSECYKWHQRTGLPFHTYFSPERFAYVGNEAYNYEKLNEAFIRFNELERYLINRGIDIPRWYMVIDHETNRLTWGFYANI